MTAPDNELLERFHGRGDESSFTELVNRHLGLVHAAALRITCQPSLAEEVSQVVFTKLARLRAPLKPGLTLVTWLHQTTRSSAIDLVRAETRRGKREKIAASLAAMSAPSDPWERISPVLDEVISRLSPDERHVILCRFFEKQTHAEVARSLGLSEDATRMRMHRALEKVRSLLQKRGITTTANALSLGFPVHAIAAVPAGLAASISHTALAAAVAPAFITTLGMITMTKKTAFAAAAVLLAAGLGTAVYIACRPDPSASSAQHRSVAPAPRQAPVASMAFQSRVRDRSADRQGSAEEAGLISRYGEARVKMAKRITSRIIGFFGEDGIGGLVPLAEQMGKQKNLTEIVGTLQLTDPQKAGVTSLLEKASQRKAGQFALLVDYLKANSLKLSETLLAGDAFKRGKISEAEYKEISSHFTKDKADFEASMKMHEGEGLAGLMADPQSAGELAALLDHSQLALLEEWRRNEPAVLRQDPAFADLGKGLEEPERLEHLDEKVNSVFHIFDGVKQVMESVRAIQVLQDSAAK